MEEKEEFRGKVLKLILEHRKDFSPSDDWKLVNELDWIYEEIRSMK